MFVARKDLPERYLRAFPEYRGQTFKILGAEQVNVNMEYIWRYSNGTHCSFEYVRFEGYYKIFSESVFAMFNKGVTFYVHPLNRPAPILEPLTSAEKAVLIVTKNHPAAERWTQARWEFGLCRPEYDIAIDHLIEKGLLTKNKSLTPKGRNYVQ